jgi:3-dehydroquinate dehydratase/shikimate dehydrogenase
MFRKSDSQCYHADQLFKLNLKNPEPHVLEDTMSTKITVPISAANKPDFLDQALKAATSGAQMLELRLDYLKNLTPDLARDIILTIKKGVNLPLIVTCRDEREGGVNGYSPELRSSVIKGAVTQGVDFVDVEFVNFKNERFSAPIKSQLATSSSTRLILSAHNFKTPFDNLSALYKDIKTDYPLAIPKIVYTPLHIIDCFEAFDLMHDNNDEKIILCMGEQGIIVRLLAKKLVGFLTFASLNQDAATAPGQLSIKQLIEMYRFSDSNPKTKLFGIIANPVGHSMSPAIHNACFTHYGMDRMYLPLKVAGGKDDVSSFLDSVARRPWLDFNGFSVTLPHKTDVLNYVRQNQGDIDPLTEKIGAANTLISDDNGQFSAYNTDYTGAMDAISQTLGWSRSDFVNKTAVVIGAGGVARAVTAGLTDSEMAVTICNRTRSRAEKLADDFGCRHASLDDLGRLKADLIVNCTSLGMSPDIGISPISSEYLAPDMAVFDTVYNPLHTQLLKDAEKKGAVTINGLEMFVGQALAQFKLFTGKDGNGELMKKIVEQTLAS